MVLVVGPEGGVAPEELGSLRRPAPWFGNIPVVKENFELVVLGIIGVSVLPIVYEVVRTFAKREASA